MTEAMEEQECKSCGKLLKSHEWHTIPTFMPATRSFTLDSAGVEYYCDDCYKEYKELDVPKQEEKLDEKRMKGIVKFFNEVKRFGFIICEDGKEVFVHKSDIKEGVTLHENDRVTFELEQGSMGLKAINVKSS